jgi:hypothetical protein
MGGQGRAAPTDAHDVGRRQFLRNAPVLHALTESLPVTEIVTMPQKSFQKTLALPRREKV